MLYIGKLNVFRERRVPIQLSQVFNNGRYVRATF